MREVKVLVKKLKALGYAAGVAALAGTAGVAAAKTIVVRATGPSSAAYPAGKVLPDNGTITLKPADVLVVLDSRGTRTLRGSGPHQLAGATQTAATTQTAFQRLLTDSGGRPSRGGVSRDPTTGATIATSPNLWFVDVRQGGTVCVADANTLKLWRPSLDGSAKATITAAGGQANSIDFAKGAMVREWPSQLPVTDGATYRVQMDGAQPVTIRFALVPTGTAARALPDTAEALAQHGCTAQLNLLAQAVSADGSAPPVG